MVIFRSFVTLTVSAAFLFTAIACTSKEPSNQLTSKAKEGLSAAESKDQPPAAAGQENLPGVKPIAPPAAMPKTMAVTGTVVQSGDNIVLSTDSGDYIVSGQDLSEMVGKTLNITGALQESNGKYAINVLSFSEE